MNESSVTEPDRAAREWTPEHLHEHLQWAVDLEMWTIPFYISALYSIREPASVPYRLLQSIVYQEMLHVNLACNVLNAYGGTPSFGPPQYGGDIPHLRFQLDTPDPRTIYAPFSTEIGPFDEERLNAMCIVEYPEWSTRRLPDLESDIRNYGSIGEFYDAVRAGMIELVDHVRGGRNQVDEFGNFYNGFTVQTVDVDGEVGLHQALDLLDAIVLQGEGQTVTAESIPVTYRNTADGFDESKPHYEKLTSILEAGVYPAIYETTDDHPPGSPGRDAVRRLHSDFCAFLDTLERKFNGQHDTSFGNKMAKLGADLAICWQLGVTPTFPSTSECEERGDHR